MSGAGSRLAPSNGAGVLPAWGWEHGIAGQGALPVGAGHCSTFYLFLSVCVATNVFRKVLEGLSQVLRFAQGQLHGH